MSVKTRRVIGSLAFAALAVAGVASAETVNCKVITSVPHTIVAGGAYCLRQTLTSNSVEPAITIAASGVLLDLNGHRLQSASPKLAAVGIYAVDQFDVKILNGTVRGFATAVHLAQEKGESTHNLVEGIRAQQSRDTGIRVEGSQSIVRRCVVDNSGDSGQYFSPGIGIHTLGLGHRVVDNDISATVGSPNGDAIVVEGGDGIIVQGNRIFSAFRSGILVLGGTNLVMGNLITHTNCFGILIAKGDSKYGDNVVQLATEPYVGGTDVGNNR